MRQRWRILHLTPTVAQTNGQYNEHCLPLLQERDLSICSFHPPAVDVPGGLRCFHGDGTSLGYLRALRAAFSEGREYDVVHAHSALTGALFVLAALARPRYLARSVYTIQNSYRNYRLSKRLLLAAIVAAYRRVVTCSESCRASMPAWLLRMGGSRIRVVQNAVDTQRAARARNRVGGTQREDTFVIACVGRLIAIKNPLTLLEAFARAAAPDWKLRFIGDGDLRPDVQAAAGARGMNGQVEATGLIPRDAVLEALVAADVFVSASRGEGLPVAVLEAMACGCPVILSDIPPHREVVCDAGFVPLVHPEDAEGFARELRRIRSLSLADRADLGLRCRSHVEQRFGLAAMHTAYERIYEEVCGLPSSVTLDGVRRGAR